MQSQPDPAFYNRRFRYDFSEKWYKGNTHLHSTASDGGKTFTELAALYASAGYDFLFRTDHWVSSDKAKDANSYPLLWLDGVELDGKDHTGSLYHVVCLGRLPDLRRENGFEAALQAARKGGALLILAHPHWSGNSLEDCLRYPFDGVEVYNHVCHWLNGKGDGRIHWDVMLHRDPNTLAFAVDDAHLRPEHPGWNGGWIMVNARECSEASILGALRRGNFYATCGPEIHSMTFDGTQLHLTTSPIQFARLVGPGSLGVRCGSFDGKLMTDVRLTVPQDWGYVYLELEDARRGRAWTHSLFIE